MHRHIFYVKGYRVTIEKIEKEDGDYAHDFWNIYVHHDVKESWVWFRTQAECLRFLIERQDRLLTDLDLRPIESA